MNKYITEFIGTFFLVLTIGMAEGNLKPLAIGVSLMCMIFMGGHISGGHFNPAVTLAVLMRGRCNIGDAIAYMISQVAGALAAAGLVYFLLNKTYPVMPGNTDNTTSALIVELIFTFALCLVVLNVATAKGTANNSFYGLAIGFTVFFAAVAGGGMSGGAFNPAVGLGPTLMSLIVGADIGKEAIPLVWIYLVGPFAGGALAAIIFRIQNPTDA
ncbi:MAG: glycerol uptake facilitator protein [Planctomycetota bacterium]